MFESDDIKPCSFCQASGRVRGLFSVMECDQCDGAGYTDLQEHWIDTHLLKIVSRWQRERRKKEYLQRESRLPAVLQIKGYESWEDIENKIRRG